MRGRDPEGGAVQNRPENDEERRALAWEKEGLSPVFGLLGTMIGVFQPEQRAQSLFQGRARSALLFFLVSFFPVAIGAFSLSYWVLGGGPASMALYVTQGVVASLAGAVGLVGSFASLAEAYGAGRRPAARAALFLAWMVPLFLVDLGPVAAHALGYSAERTELFGAMCAGLPLLLTLVGLEAAAKHGAGLAPRVSLLTGLISAILAFSVGRVALAAAGL